MGFTIHAVIGNSMYPTVNDGDYVIAYNGRFISINVGDIVIVNHPVYGTIIKRITEIFDDGAIQLAGDNPASTSSTQLGVLSNKAVIGKMLWHIRSRKTRPEQT